MAKRVEEIEEKPPLFRWNTEWRATFFGIILIIFILLGLYIEYPERVMFGKKHIGDFKPLVSWGYHKPATK